MISTYSLDTNIDNMARNLKDLNQNLVSSVNIEIDELKSEIECLKMYLSILDPKFSEIYFFIKNNKYLIENDNSVLEAFIRKLKIKNITSTI